MAKDFVPARFIGGPWNGEMHELPEVMDRVYAPVNEGLNLTSVSPLVVTCGQRVAVYRIVDNWPARYVFDREKML